MTKAEFIERVYGKKNLPRDLTKKTVAQIVDAVFTKMGDYFIRARVSRNRCALDLPGLRDLLEAAASPRMVRNPQTGVRSPFRRSRRSRSRRGRSFARCSTGTARGRADGVPAGVKAAR